MEDGVFEARKAPEIAGKPENWINSDLLTMDKMQGKVILLNFWTYSSINCLRAIESLKEMWKKYNDGRVFIIGIHTPQFEFEKNINRVKYAVKRLGISYPVLNDPERTNWNNYGNSFWPRTELIDSKGNVILDHIGESGYDDIDRKIVEELGGSPSEAVRETKRTYPFFMTKETYAGSARNMEIGSRKVEAPGGCCEYYDKGEHKEGIIYLQGLWVQTPEYLEFVGSSSNGHIVLKFYAKEVNAVLGGNGDAEVIFDGETLDNKNAGKDITFKKWRSYVSVSRPDVYNLISIERYVAGEIKMIPFTGLRIYCFSFG